MKNGLYGYAWSPSGDLITYGDPLPSLSVYLTGRSGAAPNRLFADPPSENWAGGVSSTWSPDGTAIAVGGQYESTGDIYIMNSDGTGISKLTNDGQSAEPAWRPTS